MSVNIEGISVATSGELRQLKSDVSSLTSRLNSVQNSLSDDISQVSGEVRSLSADISNASSGISSISSMINSFSHSVQNDMVSNFQRVFSQFSDTLSERIRVIADLISHVSGELKEKQEDQLLPSISSLAMEIRSVADQFRDLVGDEVIPKLNEISDNHLKVVKDEISQIRAMQYTTETLFHTLEKTNELTAGLEKTFDEYQKNSLNRTRVREAIEGEAFLKTAQKELEAMNWSRAWRMFDEAGKRLEEDARVSAGKASAKIGMGETVQAMELLEETLSRSGDNGQIISMLCRLYVLNKEYEKAEMLIENYKSSENYIESMEGMTFHKLLGVIFYHTDRVEEALLNFQQAKSLDKYKDPELSALLERLSASDLNLQVHAKSDRQEIVDGEDRDE